MSKAVKKPAKEFTTLPKLTRKQNAFVGELKNNPKQSATKAVLKTYGKPDKPLSYATAGAIATENLKKPKIISHLSNYNDIVENTITNTIIEYQNSPDIKERTLSVDTAKYVHDKIHGKATQKTENTSITISIEAMLNELI